MLSYRQYITENSSDALLSQLEAEINQLVDTWVAELKRDLANPNSSQQRGVWDRFKNTLSNMWHGRYNKSNPYYWNNKLGDDLGSNEQFNIGNLHLKDYKSLKETCDDIENILSEDNSQNLRLFRLIDTKGLELKNKLKAIFMRPEVVQAVQQNVPGGGDDYSNRVTQTNTSQAPATASPVTPQQPVARTLKDNLDANMDPTTNKTWDSLTTEEKEAWDIFGGGDSGHIPNKECFKAIGIHTLPWILRLNDPRRRILEAFQEGKIQTIEKCKRLKLKNILMRDNRYESFMNSISSKEELEERVKQLKSRKSSPEVVSPTEPTEPDPSKIKPLAEPDSSKIAPLAEPDSSKIKKTRKKKFPTAAIGGLKSMEQLDDAKARVLVKLDKLETDMGKSSELDALKDQLSKIADSESLQRFEDAVDLYTNTELEF